jgi:hypothetical protein
VAVPSSQASLRRAGLAPPFARTGTVRLAGDALQRLHRSRLGRWTLALVSGAGVAVLALLAARHFATTSWPLWNGQPGLLVASGLLLLLANARAASGPDSASQAGKNEGAQPSHSVVFAATPALREERRIKQAVSRSNDPVSFRRFSRSRTFSKLFSGVAIAMFFKKRGSTLVCWRRWVQTMCSGGSLPAMRPAS